MAIDPYSPCPGGTGKKIKFCCPDMIGELEKVERMLEGDQRAACLDHIESIEGKYPDRACLLSIKAMLQAQLVGPEKAEATLTQFTAKYPDNPVALAEKATIAASQGEGVAAIAPLQAALEKCSDSVPPQVYDAISAVAQGLIQDNQLVAGRAHLVLQLGIGGTKDQRPLELLIRLNNSPSIPLLAKQDLPLLPAPDDALWKTSFAKAFEPALRGAWRQAADQLTELAAQVGNWPAITHNIAVLRTWLADTPRAIEAWRLYATQPIPLDDAVEAEAFAQSLDPEAVDLVEVLSIEYAINDIEVLTARLTASNRALQMPIDLARMDDEEGPPPKAAFWILDRPSLGSGKDLKIADIPQVVGQAFIFGKQTDRAARVELATYRPQIERAQASLSEIAGDSLGAAGAEEISTYVPALQHLLTLNWRLPEDTTPEQRLKLINEQRQNVLLNVWPTQPQKILGGKSPQEVASDPAQKHKLLAAILLLEMATDQVASDFDFNQLRRNLGLPEAGPIDGSRANLPALPLARMARVDVKTLSDDQLVDLYRRADHYRNVAALRKLAAELIARPGMDQKVDKAEVYGLLAQVEPDTNEALAYLEKARAAAEAAKKSTAPWDLAELSLRISRGDVAEADRLLYRIREKHIREPGVAQALFQILSEAGIIGPDGRPTAAAAAAGREAPGIVVPGAGGGASESGKIWTPGSDQPSTGKKSALWTPGD